MLGKAAQQLQRVVVVGKVQRLQQDADHALAAGAQTVARVVLVAGVVSHQGRLAPEDGPPRPLPGVALQAAAADGAGQLAVFRHEHAGPRAAVGRAQHFHHRGQGAGAVGGAVLVVGQE
ncbi:hypothetical protein BEN49_03245 [Hymenobacter coccineus]|uniref:Uncharacterized protein n=1 Tax=Hymenobacter coccineus TaxID=1908235 RepID=A0A1G1SSD7_9BACT|nr:hypothetical protein BEN49_03245 [Hymenobacter coccineus]